MKSSRYQASWQLWFLYGPESYDDLDQFLMAWHEELAAAGGYHTAIGIIPDPREAQFVRHTRESQSLIDRLIQPVRGKMDFTFDSPKEERAYRLRQIKRIATQFNISTTAFPCIAILPRNNIDQLFIIRIEPHWYSSKQSKRVFISRMIEWLEYHQLWNVQDNSDSDQWLLSQRTETTHSITNHINHTISWADHEDPVVRKFVKILCEIGTVGISRQKTKWNQIQDILNTEVKPIVSELIPSFLPQYDECYSPPKRLDNIVTRLLAAPLYVTIEIASRVDPLPLKLERIVDYFRGIDCQWAIYKKRRVLDMIARFCNQYLLLKDARSGKSYPGNGTISSEISAGNTVDSLQNNTNADSMVEAVSNRKEYLSLLARKTSLDPKDCYLGSSLPVLRLFERLTILNKMVDEPILIVGETGSGKTHFNDLIHESSNRAGKYERVHSSSTEMADFSFVQGQWFGYGKNSGIQNIPRNGRDGLIQQCDGGTIFVDEIVGLSHSIQSRLFDVIDKQEIPQWIGEGPSIKPNVRLIFATNADLPELVRKGVLREDFYNRISGRKLEIPPLRARITDIPIFAAKMYPKYSLSKRFLLALLRHSWPSNVRELIRVLQVAVLKCGMGKTMKIEHLELDDSGCLKGIRELPESSVQKEIYSILIDELEVYGLKKQIGRNKLIGEILGVSPATVSMDLKKLFPGEE